MLNKDLLQATSTLENNFFKRDTQGINGVFHTLLDQSAQMMWLLNSDGVLLDANQTALDFGNVTYDQIVGRPMAAVMGWTFPDRGRDGCGLPSYQRQTVKRFVTRLIFKGRRMRQPLT